MQISQCYFSLYALQRIAATFTTSVFAAILLLSLLCTSTAQGCQFSVLLLRTAPTSQLLTLQQDGACEIKTLELSLMNMHPGATIELGADANNAELAIKKNGADADLHIGSHDSRGFTGGAIIQILDGVPKGTVKDEPGLELRLASAIGYGGRGEVFFPVSNVNSNQSSEVIAPEFQDPSAQSPLKLAPLQPPEEQMFSTTSNSPVTEHMCGDSVPDGWVTIAITSPCQLGVGFTSTGRTIEQIASLPSGTKLHICGQAAPNGWASISVDSQYCAQVGYFTYSGETIERIDGLPNGSILEICGGGLPTGWVSKSVSSNYCANIGGSSYISTTIERVDGFPSGTTVSICGGGPPLGWVTIAIGAKYCSQFGNLTYIGSTIERIDGLPNNSNVNICGGTTPDGWVTTAVSNSYCAQVGNLQFTGSTIKRIDGSRAGATINICGGAAPAGWVTTAVKPQYCAKIGSFQYTGRLIEHIDGLPIGSTLKICGDPVPADWTEISPQNGCAVVGLMNYNGSIIEKLK